MLIPIHFAISPSSKLAYSYIYHLHKRKTLISDLFPFFNQVYLNLHILVITYIIKVGIYQFKQKFVKLLARQNERERQMENLDLLPARLSHSQAPPPRVCIVWQPLRLDHPLLISQAHRELGWKQSSQVLI